MGPITSLDPPTGALSNPSNGKDPVSVLDSCQGSVKTHFDDPIHHQDTKSTNVFLGPSRCKCAFKPESVPNLGYRLLMSEGKPEENLCGFLVSLVPWWFDFFRKTHSGSRR